jgi:Xaa-Pro dipeptidase
LAGYQIEISGIAMNTRLSRLVELLQQLQIDALALNPGPTFTYLTGLQMHLMERPTVLFVTRTGQAGLVLPYLEKEKLAGLKLELQAFTYEDDPSTWAGAFRQAITALGLAQAKLAAEPSRLRMLELQFIQAGAPQAEIIDGSPIVEGLRLRKDAQELAKMREAALIAQTALIETLKLNLPGMSEKQIAAELVIALYRAGSDVALPFGPIVSSGPNTASPHAVPTERILREGDLLLFDWGAGKDGYFSDITRTFTVGAVEPELLRIGEIVFAANTKGREIARPGMPAGAVDQAVRAVIEAEGYGGYFTHRTGHGLGMEAHEAPYIYATNPQRLAPGMVFTIEPGIYLPGRGGVRIEDDVVITESGLRSLTDLPREVVPYNTPFE